MEKYDLLILGGGMAGCASAYIASKLNLKTILIEKNNFLGGMATGGLVIPVMKTENENINTEFYNDLIDTAKRFGAQIEYKDSNKGWFNPELLKIVLDDMLTNSGVKILFESDVIKVNADDNLIKNVIIKYKLLSLPIESKYFLDTSGDSKIFELLGENFINERDKKQASSLRFVMSGVNVEELKQFLTAQDKNIDVTNFSYINNELHLTSAYTFDNKNWGLKPIFEKGLKNGDLEFFDTSYFQIFTIPHAAGSIAFNCPRMKEYENDDIEGFSVSLIEARKSIFRISNFMKKYFKGFENAYISNIAPITGIRDGNRINAVKIYKKEDLLSGKKPENPVLCGDYPMDIHSNQKDKSVLEKNGKYYLSIDSLKSDKYKNLFAAGRNVGATFEAHSAIRTQASCMSMGEAVSKEVKKLIEI